MSDRTGLASKVMVEADIGRGQLGIGLCGNDDLHTRSIRLTMLTVAEARALIEELQEAIDEASRDLGAEQRAMRERGAK